MPGQKRVAIFIDVDNVSPRHVPAIMRELTSKFGEATYRRAYGIWYHANTKRMQLVTKKNGTTVAVPKK